MKSQKSSSGVSYLNSVVSVATTVGSVEINAMIVGLYLAVHPDVRPRNNKRTPATWNITHIRSGVYVVRRIADRESALELAHRLAVLNWDFYDPGQINAETRSEVERVLKIPYTWGNNPALVSFWKQIWIRPTWDTLPQGT